MAMLYDAFNTAFRIIGLHDADDDTDLNSFLRNLAQISMEALQVPTTGLGIRASIAARILSTLLLLVFRKQRAGWGSETGLV